MGIDRYIGGRGGGGLHINKGDGLGWRGLGGEGVSMRGVSYHIGR